MCPFTCFHLNTVGITGPKLSMKVLFHFVHTSVGTKKEEMVEKNKVKC